MKRISRFGDSGEEVKTIFSNIFRICKAVEIKKYSNERKELFKILDEMLATVDRINLKSNVKRDDIINVTSNSNDIKLPTLSLPGFSCTVDKWFTYFRICSKLLL